MATPSGLLIPLTGDPLKDGLIQGSRWLFSGAPTLTYSVWNTDGYVWQPSHLSQVRAIFDSYSSFINVRFEAVVPTGTVYNNNSDISIALLDTLPADGIAGFPDPDVNNLTLASFGLTRADYPTVEGDMIFNPLQSDMAYLYPGGIGFMVGLHELGHVLGLKHPHDSGGRGRPTFSSLGIATLDGNLFTVMSYARDASALSSAERLSEHG